MKVKKPESKDSGHKNNKLIQDKTSKKRVKQNKAEQDGSENTFEDKGHKIKRHKRKATEDAGGPEDKNHITKIAKGLNGSPIINQMPNSSEQRSIRKKKKKHFNKEAIDKMKARQLAKKEKLAQKTSPAAPPKPEAKRHRPKLPVRLESVNLKFSEDDDSMAQFDGVWVPRDEIGRLQSAREELKKRGLPEETVARRMKQLVRREHRKLKLSLIAAQTKTERAARERRQFLERQSVPKPRRRLPGRACGLALQEEDGRLARFDGFWVSAEALPRLEALRKQLAAEGKTEDEARRLLRKARRAEERKVKSSGKLFCTKCGGRGHLLSDCTAKAVEPAAGTACFRCGMAGHRLSDCPKKGQISGLPFATCFLCKKQGHMSRECPQAETKGTGKCGKTWQKSDKKCGEAVANGGQSWRGLTHDAGTMAEHPSPVSKISTPQSAAAPKQKARVHIKFD